MSGDIGVAIGTGGVKSGNGPKPKGRVTLSPALRRQVADLHAAQVFQEHLAPHYPSATLEQMAHLLTLRRVPAVRAKGPWTEKRMYDLLHRAERALGGCNG